MWTDRGLFTSLIFLTGVLATPYLSSLIENFALAFFKKIYKSVHEHEDEDVIFFSCWAGRNKNFYIQLPVYLLSFISVLWIFLYLEWQFFAFFVSVVLMDMAIFWNTLVKIEMERDSLRLTRLIFGTDTEIYHLDLNEIVKIEHKLMIRKFPFVGYNEWTLIYLNNGRTIYIPTPDTEACELFSDFFMTNKANYHNYKASLKTSKIQKNI